MKILLTFVLSAQAVRLRYEEAEGPTKADFGEADETVTFHQFEEGDKKWVNPLSITDDGEDDDVILNMNFKPLDENYKKFVIPRYDLDEDIVDSLESENDATKYVDRAKKAQKKQEAVMRKRQEEHEKKMAAKEAAAKKKKQEQSPD